MNVREPNDSGLDQYVKIRLQTLGLRETSRASITLAYGQHSSSSFVCTRIAVLPLWRLAFSEAFPIRGSLSSDWKLL
jgi:hypothetical protein